MKSNNQLYSNMLQAALDRLSDRDPAEISRLANVVFDGSAFHFSSLGQQITVSYPDYTITPKLHQWHIFTILHYLAFADGMPLSGKQITFSQYKDGMVRGGGFDRDVEQIIQNSSDRLSYDLLAERSLSLGAELISSNADFCARFQFMPNYPIWLKIWFADEEFPASGRMLLDSSAEHYLTIEDAVTAAPLILDKLFL